MQDFATIHSMLEFQVPWKDHEKKWVAEGEPSQVVMVKLLNIDEHSNIVYDIYI